MSWDLVFTGLVFEPQAHYDQLLRWWYYRLEVSGAEVSVAHLGDDKKIVPRRIFLKLSGCWHIAQTCLLPEWVGVSRLLSWVDRGCSSVMYIIWTSSWTMGNEPEKDTNDVYGPQRGLGGLPAAPPRGAPLDLVSVRLAIIIPCKPHTYLHIVLCADIILAHPRMARYVLSTHPALQGFISLRSRWLQQRSPWQKMISNLMIKKSYFKKYYLNIKITLQSQQ